MNKCHFCGAEIAENETFDWYGQLGCADCIASFEEALGRNAVMWGIDPKPKKTEE